MQAMDLHYSVNGAAEKIVPLLANKGVEDGRRQDHSRAGRFQARSPATWSASTPRRAMRATPRRPTSCSSKRSPIERNYTQSQQGGGGAAVEAADRSRQQIWDRQKQVITATYNATRPNDKTKTKETAEYLSDHRNRRSRRKPNPWRSA